MGIVFFNILIQQESCGVLLNLNQVNILCFFVELKNGNSLLADNATIAEVEPRKVKFYANYDDPGSDDYVYTFEIL